MGDENSNRPRTLGDYSRPSHEGYRNTIELPEGANVSLLRSDTIRLVQNGCAFHELMSKDPIQHLKDFLKIVDSIDLIAQYEEEEEWNEPIFSEKGSPDYIDANLEQELESKERRVESLMRSEVLLYYEGEFTSPKRPYREEFEGKILKLINDQKDQIKQLEEDMRKTKDIFMCLADSLIETLKVKIEAQRVHPTKIEKVTRFPTHTPSITPKTLKPTMVHRVSMISKIKPTNYRTPHQHLNSNLKMPILHSFEKNKLEYEDEDAVEIKMMGTKMDKESLEYNLL
nr:zinc finger, CCHC-type [Tanacetum cinerariifolium]